MGGNENVLAARSESVDPASRRVVVLENETLLRPPDGVLGRLLVPTLERGTVFGFAVSRTEIENDWLRNAPFRACLTLAARRSIGNGCGYRR